MNSMSNDISFTNDASSRYIDRGDAVLGHTPELPGQSQSKVGRIGTTDGPSENVGRSKPLLRSNIPAAPAALSLPTGGGAIRGMGEKFTVNSSNGTGTFSIPIKASPSRSGVEPNLSLNYDSGNGNGEFGLGWRLSGVDAITRKTSKGLPRYNDHGSDEESDVFILAGAEDLVPSWKQTPSGEVIFDEDGRPLYDESVLGDYVVRVYTPRVVTVFNRVERWTNTSNRGDIYWRIISADNITSIFGSSESSRIYDTASKSTGTCPRIFSWLPAEVYDSRGNAMIFEYKREDSANVALTQANELNRSNESRHSNLYLKRISYGNVTANRNQDTWEAFSAFSLPRDETTWKYSLVLDYGEHAVENPKPEDSGSWACRLDPFSRYTASFEIRTYRLCRRILVFHHFEELAARDYLVSSVDLSYEESPTVTYLIAAELAGYSGNDAGGQAPFRESLPPVEFNYSRFPSVENLAKLSVEEVDHDSIQNLPVGLDGTQCRWVDLDGEGISGLLTLDQDAWYYKRNMSATNHDATSFGNSMNKSDKLSVRFGSLEVLDHGPFSMASAMNMQFVDVTGNGKLDLVSHETSMWGYYERDEDAPLGWSEFRPFRNFPNVQPGRTLQFIDLTGDGLADVLLCDDRVFTWYSSRGSEGYGPPQMSTQSWEERDGPVCVFADSEQSIYLADMSGDGLVDLCRIRNGDCCYWPQLGYGQFGSQVCFDNAPWFDFYDQFDHSRVRITDIDGSGTADVIYLTNDGIEIYLNQSGNSFSDKKFVPFPPLSTSSAFSSVDLLGNGTQCLVWSSPLPNDASNPMRYVDIFKSIKPHLLTEVTNNLGAKTRITYAPSTKFYLEDKLRGRPWITKLPFPVQTVESVETLDLITGNKFVTCYRYAHGFYDGVEREFRGFARVEQTEKSNFAGIRAVSPSSMTASWDAPPMRTVSWFHTGAYFKKNVMSELLSKEYFNFAESVPGSLVTLSHTAIPLACREGLQRMEACRALKGHVLRTEIYSDDGSDMAGIPYSVQETNYNIVATQPIQDMHFHGIYYVHVRETLGCHFERVAQDPRIAHQMILDVDAFGNIRKDLRISYGRQVGQSSLEPDRAAKQETMTILYNEADFTKSLEGNHYRAPAPCESRQYEVRGLKPSGSNTLFQFDELAAESFRAILSLPEIPFEDESNSGHLSRRLLRRERALFRKDDLSGLLPFGLIESLSLPGAYHQLVFSPGLFSTIYSKRNANGSLEPLLSGSEALDGKGYVDVDRNAISGRLPRRYRTPLTGRQRRQCKSY